MKNINVDLTLQAFWQIVPLVATLVTLSLLLLIAVLITWLITKHHYQAYIEHQIDLTADNIVAKYKAKIEEIEELQTQLMNEKTRRCDLRAIFVKLLEKMSI